MTLGYVRSFSIQTMEASEPRRVSGRALRRPGPHGPRLTKKLHGLERTDAVAGFAKNTSTKR